MVSLSTGDKVVSRYNRTKGISDFPEKTVPAGTEGRVVSVNYLSDTVDVKFFLKNKTETTHRKVSKNDLEKG